MAFWIPCFFWEEEEKCEWEPPAHSRPCVQSTHAGDSDVLKKVREVGVIEPRGAAKQKEKITPADVQTGGNKYSKADWINTVFATQLKFCSRNRSLWKCILCVYVHILSRKLKILRQCVFDWWFFDYQVTRRHPTAFISASLMIAILRRLSCCSQIIILYLQLYLYYHCHL